MHRHRRPSASRWRRTRRRIRRGPRGPRIDAVDGPVDAIRAPRGRWARAMRSLERIARDAECDHHKNSCQVSSSEFPRSEPSFWDLGLGTAKGAAGGAMVRGGNAREALRRVVGALSSPPGGAARGSATARASGRGPPVALGLVKNKNNPGGSLLAPGHHAATWFPGPRSHWTARGSIHAGSFALSPILRDDDERDYGDVHFPRTHAAHVGPTPPRREAPHIREAVRQSRREPPTPTPCPPPPRTRRTPTTRASSAAPWTSPTTNARFTR